jgi:DNA-binding transcriptional LysR family regulator
VVQKDLSLNELVAFEAVARHLRFARAAAELGVTPTAMSKLIRRLEASLDVRLFHRTTRSVALTEAGQQLAATAAPALAQLRSGLEQVGGSVGQAVGTLRVNTSYVAFEVLLAPHLRTFTRAHPRVELDITVDNVAGDIVRRGFDLGIRPGRALQRDMVAVQLGGPQRLIVVGSPAYLAHAGSPASVSDLLAHDCIRQRLGGDRWLEWSLVHRGKPLTPAVTGHLVVDEMRAALDSAAQGNGLAYVFESFAAQELSAKRVKRVLEDHALPREPFFLYYPSRASLPAKVRAFIDHFRERNRRS